MKAQNVNNHKKAHPLFHFFIMPVLLLLVAASLVNVFISGSLMSVIHSVATILLYLIAFITRVYATKNQDRIIRLEMRLRYYQLTGELFDKMEQQLSISQIAALRFADDDELLSLLNNSQTFEIGPKEIKYRIQHWKPDHLRV